MAAAKTKSEVVVHDTDALALALDEGAVRTLWFDPEVAKRACADGIAYIAQQAAKLEAKLTASELKALRQIPGLCDRTSQLIRRIEQLRTAQLGFT